ncbi:MAG: hypothetical protein LWW79_08765 [Holophagaceae bacterium]|nr:hypothetical protein [Holophagaceae bacterium]
MSQLMEVMAPDLAPIERVHILRELAGVLEGSQVKFERPFGNYRSALLLEIKNFIEQELEECADPGQAAEPPHVDR